jgi:hypothetical protein
MISTDLRFRPNALLPLSLPTTKLVTTYLVVRKGQIPCKRYCKLGHQTPYSRHQQRPGPCYKSSNERW